MLEQFVGHRPRVTAYFAVLAVGLSLLLAGVEAARLRLVGPLDPATLAGYAGVAFLFALALAFVAAYVNESLVAAWLTGAVPAAATYGGTVVAGRTVELETVAVVSTGLGLVVGGVGYGIAMEKHRREATSTDLPSVTPRVTTVSLAAASVAVGATCLVVGAGWA